MNSARNEVLLYKIYMSSLLVDGGIAIEFCASGDNAIHFSIMVLCMSGSSLRRPGVYIERTYISSAYITHAI